MTKKLRMLAVFGLLLVCSGLVAAEVARVDYGVASMRWDAQVPSYDRATLMVAGPSGVVSKQQFGFGEALAYGLQNQAGDFLPDGNYTYELVFESYEFRRNEAADRDERFTSDRQRQTGFFAIAGGLVRDIDPMRPETMARVESAGATRIEQAAFDVNSTFTVSLKIGIGTMVPLAPLDIVGTDPTIRLEDTNVGDVWRFGVTNSGFGFSNDPSGTSPDRRVVGFEDGAPADSLYVSALGFTGLGTNVPLTTLHVVASKTILRWENTGNGRIWDNGVDTSGNYYVSLISTPTASNTGSDRATVGVADEAFSASNFLTLEDVENPIEGGLRRGLGVHTPDPTAYLHVMACAGCAGAPLVKVDGSSLADGKPAQLQIISKDTKLGSGSAALTYLDKASGDAATFEFRTLGGTPSFSLNFVGTGGTEFEINKEAVFRLGKGGTSKFTVDTQGDVTANSYNLASARALKENFSAVSARDVLERVAALDISRWNYKTNGAVPHIGPIAEDFYAAFGVGSDSGHINVVDAAGVSLVAIQGLYQSLADKDSALQALSTENQSLEDRVLRLEALVAQLVDR